MSNMRLIKFIGFAEPKVKLKIPKGNPVPPNICKDNMYDINNRANVKRIFQIVGFNSFFQSIFF